MTDSTFPPEVLERYRGRTVVIKYGGSAMKSEALKRQVLEDVAALHGAGARVVLAHGGGPEINAMLSRLDVQPRFVEGLRVTDETTMEVVAMVLAGKVNKSLTAMLCAMGAPALGLSGADGGMLLAVQRDPALGYVGDIAAVDPRPIETALAAGYIPVICSVAADKDGQFYNINADTAAARIAGALGAERLFMMTDTPGVLRDKDDEASLIPHIAAGQAEALYAQGVVSGGMIPKVACCVDAVARGVEKVIVMDGRREHSIRALLLAGEEMGTTVTEA